MHERELLSYESAVQRVLSTAPDVTSEGILLAAATGRVLAEDIRCEADVPASDVSAMDGFAVRACDLVSPTSLRLVGEALAGAPFEGALQAGDCARVMTGGIIPTGADAVVPVEQSSGFEPALDGTVAFQVAAKPGDNVRLRASVRAEGDIVLQRGLRLDAAKIAVLAQQGCTELRVARRPRVAILPTGDEVVAIDEQPGRGQVRNSNAWCLEAQVTACGGEAFREDIVRDREGDSEERLRRALEGHDLVCTIGGVSMGTRDLVRGAFDRVGGRALVEATRIKPGKPTFFGSYTKRDGTTSYLLGLPGNPASSFTIFELFGAPWIRKAMGLPEDRWRPLRAATLVGAAVRANWRLQLVPARVTTRAGRVEVEALDQRSSADLFSLALGNALLFVPEGSALANGDLVSYLPLRDDGF